MVVLISVWWVAGAAGDAMDQSNAPVNSVVTDNLMTTPDIIVSIDSEPCEWRLENLAGCPDALTVRFDPQTRTFSFTVEAQQPCRQMLLTAVNEQVAIQSTSLQSDNITAMFMSAVR